MTTVAEEGAPTRPPRLRPGDTVAVCAPAGPVTEDRMRAGLARLRERYRVVVDPHLYARRGYLAGDDRARASALNCYLRDPEVRAIFIARGGYGLHRILDRFDAAALARDPVPIVGFSDVTALLSWALRRAGVASIHGPVVTQLGHLEDDEVAWLFRLLEDPSAPGELPWELSPVGAELTEPRRGPLVGGNLCLAAHLAGTPYAVDARGAILLLEEVGERPYRLDRYLTHLRLAGATAGAQGAIVGDLRGCEEPEDAPGAAEVPAAMTVVGERLRAFSLPGLRGAPVGHGARNAALPIGVECVLEPGGRVALAGAAVR